MRLPINTEVSYRGMPWHVDTSWPKADGSGFEYCLVRGCCQTIVTDADLKGRSVPTRTQTIIADFMSAWEGLIDWADFWSVLRSELRASRW